MGRTTTADPWQTGENEVDAEGFTKLDWFHVKNGLLDTENKLTVTKRESGGEG